jgi:hypothetical protein
LYFPALRYSLPELQTAIRKPADLPLVHRFGRGGFNNPAYTQAYADALKASGANVEALSKYLASLPR